MRTGTTAKDNVSSLDQWRQQVADLATTVRGWSEEQGWPVEEKLHEIDEGEPFGQYSLPLLIIQLPKYPVFLQPVARFVGGAEGRVDLYAYPTYDRVMLLRKSGSWVVRPEMGPTWPLPWSRDTFVDLAMRLAEEK